MSKATRIWLFTATALLLIGCIAFLWVMTMLKWDFSKLSTAEYETNNHEISEKFHDISIKTDTADVVFSLSDNEKCKVVCYEDKKAKHKAFVKDGALYIEREDSEVLNRLIGFNCRSEKITIYLPKAEYKSLIVKGKTGDIKLPKKLAFQNADISLNTGGVVASTDISSTMKIKTTTGDIHLENISVGALYVSASTGKITVSGLVCTGDIEAAVTTGNIQFTDSTCKSITSSGSTGNIRLSNVTADKFSITRSTGDISFDGCDADDIFAKTSTGDIKGSFLTDKVFSANSSTGRVDVPNSKEGGKCELNTATGDIEIR